MAVAARCLFESPNRRECHRPSHLPRSFAATVPTIFTLVGKWVNEDRLPLDDENVGETGVLLADNRTVAWLANEAELLEQRV